MQFPWSNTAPKEIKLNVFTKKDHVVIYNICERETTYLICDSKDNPVENHSKTTVYFLIASNRKGALK